ncbi:ABC transporter permease subunit [Bacillus sp. H-16]|uniref:ABC transporter permease n=1 Tax=Alteribacter salitolerans TaxID=2912333 RepID=UPI001965F350|nr:ABC transporter permease subunit [Alteribacter salitolerans]MBM7096499.1 ABC transporter permease subunit [Alteribacter salitolerans]
MITVKKGVAALGLILSLIVFVIPVILLFLQSISTPWRFGMLFPDEFTLRGWNQVLSDPALLHSLLVTVGIGSAVIVLNLLIAIPAAKALASKDFRGKGVVDTLLFLPILIPVLAIAIGLHFAMIRFGLADSWTGVVLVHLIPTVPYSIRIFRSAFERTGARWEDQGRVLGSTDWQIFLHIQLPQFTSSIRAAVFLTMVISLSQYVLTVIIGGGRIVTLPMLYYPYVSSGNDTVLAAFSLLFAAVPVIVAGIVELLIRLLSPYPSQWNRRG